MTKVATNEALSQWIPTWQPATEFSRLGASQIPDSTTGP